MVVRLATVRPFAPAVGSKLVYDVFQIANQHRLNAFVRLSEDLPAAFNGSGDDGLSEFHAASPLIVGRISSPSPSHFIRVEYSP